MCAVGLSQPIRQYTHMHAYIRNSWLTGWQLAEGQRANFDLSAQESTRQAGIDSHPGIDLICLLLLTPESESKNPCTA